MLVIGVYLNYALRSKGCDIPLIRDMRYQLQVIITSLPVCANLSVFSYVHLHHWNNLFGLSRWHGVMNDMLSMIGEAAVRVL